MPHPTPPPAPPRRQVLRGLVGLAGLAGFGALAACDVRLESDAPAIPVLPRQEGVDERLLLALAGAVSTIGALARAAPTSSASERRSAAAVADACAAQGKAMAEMLAADGVPAAVIAGPMSSPSTAAASTVRPSGTTARLDAVWAAQARLVTERVTDPATVAVATGHRALVASVLTHHATRASLHAAPPRWPNERLPSAPAAIALDRMRAARYGLTVAAAHLSGGPRTRLVRLDAALHRIEGQLREQAGRVASPAPPAYDLPVVVTDQTTATRLVTSVMADLGAGVLSPLVALPPGSPGLAAVVQHASEVLVLTAPWSGPLAALPGLHV